MVIITKSGCVYRLTYGSQNPSPQRLKKRPKNKPNGQISSLRGFNKPKLHSTNRASAVL